MPVPTKGSTSLNPAWDRFRLLRDQITTRLGKDPVVAPTNSVVVGGTRMLVGVWFVPDPDLASEANNGMRLGCSHYKAWTFEAWTYGQSISVVSTIAPSMRLMRNALLELDFPGVANA